MRHHDLEDDCFASATDKLAPAVIVGGLRVLGANVGGSREGVLTQKVGTLTNDFFVNLLDMNIEWKATGTIGAFEGKDRKTGAPKRTGSRVDLVFRANSMLRVVAYESSDAGRNPSRPGPRRCI